MTSARTIIALPILRRRRAPRRTADTASASHPVSNRAWPAAVLVAAAMLAVCAAARASCNDDCRNEYVSALSECRAQYQSGDTDLQDLQDCLADTQGEYDDCIDDCTSLGAGGVVACAAPHGALTPVKFTGRVPATSD
jgi:hypothetical protein